MQPNHPFFSLTLLSLVIAASNIQAKEPTAEALITGMENLLWSKTSHGQFTMTIKTPWWERALTLEAWMDRPKQSFIRIHAPKKEKGIGSLRIGSEMWNYLPKIDRTVKVPPSMMLQPWMGSDFSNDDLVKESSLATDYTHEITDREITEGHTLYHITATPNPDASVVWGKLELRIREDFIPLEQDFFDSRGNLVKKMTYSDIKMLSGRNLPTLWKMTPIDKPDQFTEIRINDILFDAPINPAQFTLQQLRKP